MGVFLASGSVSRVQVKSDTRGSGVALPGSDPLNRLQRALSSQEDLPYTAVAYYTQGKTKSVKRQTRADKEVLCWLWSPCPVDLPWYSSGALGSQLQSLTRPRQLLLSSFSSLCFSLICQAFFFFFLFFKLRV